MLLNPRFLTFNLLALVLALSIPVSVRAVAYAPNCLDSSFSCQKVFQGPLGPMGLPGDRGAQGMIGATGAPGITGKRGLPGPSGATGATGSQGLAGQNGVANSLFVLGLNSLFPQNSSLTFNPESVVMKGTAIIQVGVDQFTLVNAGVYRAKLVLYVTNPFFTGQEAVGLSLNSMVIANQSLLNSKICSIQANFVVEMPMSVLRVVNTGSHAIQLKNNPPASIELTYLGPSH